MKITAILICLFISLPAISQKKLSSKIVVTLKDSIDIRAKVKKAFALQNFMLKDIDDSDTLSTFPAEINGVYAVGFAEIRGNTVTLFGFYGLKTMDSFGYTNAAKKYNRILYFKASKAWPLLANVAASLGGEIAYQKE